MRIRQFSGLVGGCLALGGCCSRPHSAWDRTATLTKPNLPGVVVVAAKGRTWMSACTGTIVKASARGTLFDEYVLTARHCLVKDEQGPFPLGVTVPRHGEDKAVIDSEVFDATVAYVSRSDETVGAKTVVWDEGDWAILRISTPTRLPVLDTFAGDPKNAMPPGANTELLTYADRAYIDLHAHRAALVAHSHPWPWTGVPEPIEQGGHSGAPVTWDGKLVAMFVGTTDNSLGCKLVCDASWPKKLHFVSVASVREQAARVGFRF